jgi:hypothetical protein
MKKSDENKQQDIIGIPLKPMEDDVDTHSTLLAV